MNKLTKLKSATLIYGESYQDAIPAVPASPKRTYFIKISYSPDVARAESLIKTSPVANIQKPTGGDYKYDNIKMVKPATPFDYKGSDGYSKSGDYLARLVFYDRSSSSSSSSSTNNPYLSLTDWLILQGYEISDKGYTVVSDAVYDQYLGYIGKKPSQSCGPDDWI